MLLYQHSQVGQSILEILFAMSIATVFLSSVVYVMLSSQTATRFTIEHTRAEALAEEGLIAVRSIARNSFSEISEGTHGLTLAGNTWQLSGSGDSSGKYNRSLAITAVDEDVFEVVATVSWSVGGLRDSQVAYTTYLTNWQQTDGDNSWLSFDTDATTYGLGGTVIENTTIENVHATKTITITELRLFWDGSPELDDVTIGGLEAYTASTSGLASSGELLDIADISIGVFGPPVQFGPLVFTADMQSTDVLIVLYLADNSRRYLRLIP